MEYRDAEQPLLQNGGNHEVSDGLDEKEKPFSLAFYKTTPKISVVLISITMVIAHLLFLIGQTSVMWYLMLRVDYEGAFKALDFETEILFRALKLKNPLHVNVTFEYHVEDFTYGLAVQRLWQATGLNSTVGPRTCAMVLILFSGIWPHLKLVLLNYYWLLPSYQSSRTAMFYWLSTFGKWSLADVLVVCVLIGVVNLDIHLDSGFVLYRIQEEVPQIISALEKAVSEEEAVKDICHGIFKLKDGGVSFDICSGVVYELYYHPHLVERAVEGVFKGVHASGGGVVALRIAGLIGIYLFSGGVIISLILGLIIDTYDHHAKSSMRYRRRPSAPEDERPKYFFLIQKVNRNFFTPRGYALLICCTFVALSSGILGVLLSSMERRVPGAVPEIINETLNVDFTRFYSLYSLTVTTGAKGGADYFLLSVFAFFCVVGPLLRSAIVLMHLLLPLTKALHARILYWGFALGAFSAWDVFFLALYLVNLEMPPITNTLIDPHSQACSILKQFGRSNTCLEIEYGLAWPGFLFLMIAFATHLISSVIIVRLGFHALDPYHDGDTGGPYCPKSFRSIFLWDRHALGNCL